MLWRRPLAISTAGVSQGGEGLTGNFDEAHAIAVQPDGKIVVAGSSFSNATGEDIALARYKADGSLDPSFGVGSRVLTDFGGGETAFALALQADGRIVVAG